MLNLELDRILHVSLIVWWVGILVLVMTLNVLPYRKAWLAAMMDQVDRDGVIHQNRINVGIGKGLRSWGYMFMSLPNEADSPKYFRYASIRSEVASIRRFVRTLGCVALIWAGLFPLIAILINLARS